MYMGAMDSHMTKTGARHVILPERGLVKISGPEAKSFLNALVSNDVEKVAPNQAVYAALLTPQGKFLFDFLIVESGDSLLLDCEGGRQSELQRRLTLYKLRAKIEISDARAAFTIGAVFGDGALDAVGLPAQLGHVKPYGGGLVLVDPRLVALGARVILPAEHAGAALEEAGIPLASAAEYDLHRLKLGVPDGSRDMAVDKALLLEANFESLHGVDFAKGCYVGQELTARTKHRGLLKKQLFVVRGADPLPEAETPVMLDGKEAGTMRSIQGGLGLALLRLELVDIARSEGRKLLAGESPIELLA